MLLLFTYACFLKPIKKAWYCPRMKTFQNLKEFLLLALPGVLMLLLENSNMQIMVLLSGLFGSEDAIAAQTLVVAFGDFVIMIPYGLGLGVVTLIGNSLGSNQPKQSRHNFKLTFAVSTSIALIVCTSVALCRYYLSEMYTSDPAVISLASTAFLAFSVAFFFDWT